MPDVHSKILGSSTASRRYNCPGSIDLEAQFPNVESSYAAEGTGLHSAMEYLLGEDLAAEDAAGMVFYNIPMDVERVGLLRYCIEAFDETVGDNPFYLEKTLPFPGVEGSFGTGDVIWFEPNPDGHTWRRMGVMDWKFGGGVPVYTPGNMQAKFLLSSARAHYPQCTPETELHAQFVQPRLDYKEAAQFTHTELDAFEADIRHAINVRRYQDDNLKTGSWCRFCNAVAACPAHMAKAREALAWGNVSKDLPAALALLDDLETFISGVRAAAHNAMTAGAEVQGWKLVNKRSTGRVWDLPEDEVDRALYRKFGLLKGQRFNNTLISPAQAEKLVGKGKVDDMVRMKESSGTTLAREDDKREAVNRPARTLSAFSTAITQKDGNK